MEIQQLIYLMIFIAAVAVLGALVLKLIGVDWAGPSWLDLLFRWVGG